MVPLPSLWYRFPSPTRRGSQRHQVSVTCRKRFSMAQARPSSRPANILLSHKSIPVLVDFGFAEKYELNLPTAFHSNLSYGTPEVREQFNRNWILYEQRQFLVSFP
jgi:hypothetical protein